MAAEYEVNIKLNTGKAETQLKNIESSVAKIGKAEKQSVNTTDRRVASLVKLRSIGDDIAAFEKKGVDMSKARNQLKAAGVNIEKKMFLTANQRMGVAVKELRTQQGITKQLEQQEKARRRQRTKRAEGVALGAGFPLLFGGGPGAVLGGAAGGLTGSFGAQIALSAIGQQVDQFVASVAEAGKAFNSTGGALDYMREKSLFSSAATEERAAVLEELGRVEELATLLTEELTGKIGNEGVRSLQELGKTTDETTRLWNELTTQLFALVSGPLNSFLKIVNQVLGGVATSGRFAALSRDLAGDKEFEAAVAARKGGRAGVLSQAEKLELLELFGPKVATTAQIPITAEDRRRFAVKDTAGGKTAREEERIQQRLAALEVERQKILEISAFKDRIAAAEAASDSQLVIRLQGEQQIAEIEAKRLEDLTKVKDQRLIDAINITAATEKLAAQREIERQLAEDQRKRQELFETTIEDLEHQLAMVEATSQAERDRLKIARELKKLEDKGFTDSQVAQAGDLMQRLATAQEPLNAFIRKTTEDLTNLQQVAVDVSQGIGNAIGSSLVNGLGSLVAGASSAKEVFADLLKSVADVLANVAKQMIAQYIAIGVARLFAGIGSEFGSGASAPKIGTDVNYFGGGFTPMDFFAEGGFVNKPTSALIGEGGEPEYVIPQSKMQESMARFSAGARGSSVIPANGGGGGDYGGVMGGGTVVNYNGPTLNFNSEDYVPASAVPGIIDEAAKRGAKAGETRTFASLQNSRSRRSRIGLGS